MKKNITSIILLFTLPFIFLSCSKQINYIGEANAIDGNAYIKFAHFSPNFRNIINGRDSFNIYVNGNKVNGPFFTFGSIFPTVTNLYAAVPTGNQLIRLTVNGVTTPDSVTLAGFTKNLVAGKYYSFFLTDSILSADASKQMFVEDNFARTDTLHYTVRLVHAIINDFGGNIDVFSFRLGANMFSNISPSMATSFTAEPYNLTQDTLSVRRAGTATELARLNSVVFARERAYTLVYKGLPGSTTAPKGRALVILNNQ